MERRPCSIHSWAQAQRASIALNYYKTDMNFFKPRIHKFYKGEGITGLEFPLVNYVPAVLYKIFGFNEKYYRGFVLFSLFMGLFFFNLLTFSFVKNYLLSIGLLASGYLSPVLMYYSNNFMPDVTSVSFVLISWYFFFRFVKEGKSKFYLYCIVCIMFAALIKVVSLIPLFVIFGIFILDYLKFFKSEGRDFLFTKKSKLILLGILILIPIVAWYSYARWLTIHHDTKAFALEVVAMPDSYTNETTFKYIKSTWLFQYYAYETYVLIGIVILILLIGFRFLDRLLFSVTALTLAGSACFVYLFFSQFKFHDYYIIPLLPGIFLLMLTFGDLIHKISNKYFIGITLILIVGLAFNNKECLKKCRQNYMGRYDSSIFYMTWDYTAYEDLEPKLRKLGVKRTDRTLVGYDESFCTSLYLMDQLGYTFGAKINKPDLDYDFGQKRYKYLILTDSAAFNKVYPNNFAEKIIGTHRGLIIYKLFN